MSGPAERPIACELKALDAGERTRQKELLGIVRGKIRHTIELATGFEIHFSSEPGTLAEVAEWVGLERRCCAFAQIEVDHRPGERISVHVTGGPGAKEVLAAEMGLKPGALSANV